MKVMAIESDEIVIGKDLRAALRRVWEARSGAEEAEAQDADSGRTSPTSVPKGREEGVVRLHKLTGQDLLAGVDLDEDP